MTNTGFLTATACGSDQRHGDDHTEQPDALSSVSQIETSLSRMGVVVDFADVVAALLQPDGQDDGCEREDHCGGDGDAVQVALDHRRACRRTTNSTAKHVRQPAASPAV